jgi:hypothetical protein
LRLRGEIADVVLEFKLVWKHSQDRLAGHFEQILAVDGAAHIGGSEPKMEGAHLLWNAAQNVSFDRQSTRQPAFDH